MMITAINVTGERYAAYATSGVQPCQPGAWTHLRLRLQGYPPGCRRAFVVLKGCGMSALLGESVGVWGCKFAAPTLRLVPPGEAQFGRA